MASKAIAGFAGKLLIKNGASFTAIAEVRDATLTIEQSEIDVTSFDSGGWVENIGGLNSFSIDCEALWRSDDTTGQDAIFSALTGGTVVTVQLFPKDATSAEGYQGDVIVTSFEVGVPIDDAVTVSISLIGTGALTAVTKGA
jgi:TP901-1 family phage major tail protein